MEVSRTVKNLLLVGCNFAMFIICSIKFWRSPAELSEQMHIWLFVSPFVLFAAVVPAIGRRSPIAHASLFLLTGAAIGITLGSAVSRPGALWAIEWIWLALAIVCTAIHYSPSKEDPYLP